MYDQILRQIAATMQSYGYQLQPPCSREKLNELHQRIRDELAVEPQDAHMAFLAKANGLNWNGLTIYASERTPIVGFDDRFIDGVVEANLDHREYPAMREVFVLAEDDVAMFVFDAKSQEYQVRTNISLDVLESYTSFDEMMKNALAEHQ